MGEENQTSYGCSRNSRRTTKKRNLLRSDAFARELGPFFLSFFHLSFAASVLTSCAQRLRDFGGGLEEKQEAL